MHLVFSKAIIMPANGSAPRSIVHLISPRKVFSISHHTELLAHKYSANCESDEQTRKSRDLPK